MNCEDRTNNRSVGTVVVPHTESFKHTLVCSLEIGLRRFHVVCFPMISSASTIVNLFTADINSCHRLPSSVLNVYIRTSVCIQLSYVSSLAQFGFAITNKIKFSTRAQVVVRVHVWYIHCVIYCNVYGFYL